MTLKDIGNHLKFLRRSKDIKQIELAIKLNLDRTYISKVECGKQNITLDTLITICEVGLGITVRDFFLGINDEI